MANVIGRAHHAGNFDEPYLSHALLHRGKLPQRADWLLPEVYHSPCRTSEFGRNYLPISQRCNGYGYLYTSFDGSRETYHLPRDLLVPGGSSREEAALRAFGMLDELLTNREEEPVAAAVEGPISPPPSPPQGTSPNPPRGVRSPETAGGTITVPRPT